MKKLISIKRRIICTVLAVLAAFSMAAPVGAVDEPDIIDIFFEKLKESFVTIENTSSVSSDKVFVGETVTLFGSVDGVDPDRCQYSFLIKRNLFFTETLQKYGSNRVFYWTPEETGVYELIVKVRYGLSAYRKSFKITVTHELFNDSLMSSSFVQSGDTVELLGRSHGGDGDVQYGFFYKESYTDQWSVLGKYGSADSIKWRPKDIGTYDVCIKVRDGNDQIKKKYFTLTVAEMRTKTPTEFTIAVKAPISSPYFWRCSFSEDNILTYTVKKKSSETQQLKMYVLMEYKFRTVAAGKTNLKLVYNSYGDTECSLDYEITVDKTLNFKVDSSEGNYFDDNIPKPEQQKTKFALAVKKAGIGYRWKVDISNTGAVQLEKCDSDDSSQDVYYFSVLREGHCSVVLTCDSVSDMSDKYKLVYNLSADQDIAVTVTDYDGYYVEDESLPQIYIVHDD